MKIPASSLEAFLAVARSSHFGRAAKALGLSQSALSQRVLNLESQLEATLFVRDRKGARLTPEVEEFLRYAQTLENLEAEFLGTRSDSKNAPQSLRVAGFSSVTRSILLPALAPLARESAMRLSLLSRELGELPGLLRRGEADLIVVDTEPERDDAEGIFLGYEENVLVRSSHKKSPELFLDHDAEDLTTARYLQKFLPGTKRPERLYLDEIYALLDGVKLGLGQAVLPLHLVRGDKGLSVPHPGKVLRVPVWLQFPRQSYYPRSQREAREAIILHAASVLARK